MTSGGPSGSNANLFDFFHGYVSAAAAHQRTPVSEEGLFYLSNLLAERSRTPDDAAPQTLVELNLQARTSDHSGAVRSYREAGDRALYLSGFFRQHIRHRSLVDIEYYLHMGAAAYASLAELLAPFRARDSQGGHKSLPDLFAELSERFQTCSEVLFEVEQEVRAESAPADAPASDAEILALYERWLKTGSRAAARRLQALGLLPTRGTPEPC